MKNPFLNDHFILFLIFINALVMYFQCFDGFIGRMAVWIDTVLIVCFLIEMFSKFWKEGFCGYWKDGWNRFDGIVTIISSFSMAQAFVQSGSFGAFGSLEFLITLRIFRVFRFFRVLRFIPSIQSIMAGTRKAILSSYVIIFAFLVVIFIVSIVSCNLFRNVAPEYFGTPNISFYTTFRLFTVEGWYEIPDRIADKCSSDFCASATKFYFGFLLFFGGIIGMSFINSIIVDAMVSDNNDELVEHVRQLEKKIDLLLEERNVQKPGDL